MIGIKRIFPECNADTLLVEMLLQRGRPSHYQGINNVGKALIGYPKNNFIVGLIDTDKFKREDPNIELFTELVDDKLAEENLLIKKQPGTNKYIIRLHPAFEKFIWTTATMCNVNPEDYGYKSFDKFKCKDEDVYDNGDFKKFVNAIIKKDPPTIQTPRHWLNKAIT